MTEIPTGAEAPAAQGEAGRGTWPPPGSSRRLRPIRRSRGSHGPKAESAAILYSPDEEILNRRDSLRRRALAVADVLALMAALGVLLSIAPPAHHADHELLLLAAIPLWVVLNKALRLYDRDANLLHKSTLNELPAIVQSISFGTALVSLFAPVIHGVVIGRAQAVVFWAAACVLTPLFRYGARAVVRTATPRERVLILGSGHVASLVSRKLAQHPNYGTDVVGYVDVGGEPLARQPDAGIAHLGDAVDFARVCREHDIERVVIAFSSLTHEHLLDMIRESKRLRLKISVVPRLFEVIGHNVEIDQIEGMTLLGLRGLSRSRSTLKLKRGMDIAGAAIGLAVLSPLLLAFGAAIKLTSTGPMLYRQRRVGRNNQVFEMLKLRTMVAGADAMKAELRHLNDMAGGPMFKMARDPRVTGVGRFLRATSLDEIPQLWNVLRGEMSLVGPRPLVEDETDHIIGWHRARLDLTPGLTGPWQVMGRNTIPFDEMVKLDYLYVADWSLWNDVKLMLRTLPVVLARRGS